VELIKSGLVKRPVLIELPREIVHTEFVPTATAALVGQELPLKDEHPWISVSAGDRVAVLAETDVWKCVFVRGKVQVGLIPHHISAPSPPTPVSAPAPEAAAAVAMPIGVALAVADAVADVEESVLVLVEDVEEKAPEEILVQGGTAEIFDIFSEESEIAPTLVAEDEEFPSFLAEDAEMKTACESERKSVGPTVRPLVNPEDLVTCLEDGIFETSEVRYPSEIPAMCESAASVVAVAVSTPAVLERRLERCALAPERPEEEKLPRSVLAMAGEDANMRGCGGWKFWLNKVKGKLDKLRSKEKKRVTGEEAIVTKKMEKEEPQLERGVNGEVDKWLEMLLETINPA
jgi:hypothetical protein